MARAALLLLLAASSLSCFATAEAPPAAHVFLVRTHTLPNGLRVVIEQDDTAKIAGVAWVIDVGQADDPGSRPGMAHLVEHLLFALPDETGASTWHRLVDLGAAPVNATTGSDRTTVYAFTPRAALDDLLKIVLASAGYSGLGLDEARLAQERPVLDEELTLRDADGGHAARLLLNSMADRPFDYPSADVRAALAFVTVDDVRAFLAAHYRPERMTLILSGPIPPDRDRRFLAALPAGLAGAAGERRLPLRHALAPFDGAAPRPEIATVSAPVLEPELWLAWPLPPVRGKAEVPFRMTARVAGRMLAARAEGDEPSAMSGASAFTIPSAAAHLFVVRLHLRRDADAEAARREARKVLDQLAALPVADWLREPRRRAGLHLQEERLREALGMESLVSRTLRRAALSHDSPDETVSDLVSAVIDSSLEGVSGVVSRYLDGPPARSLLLTPQQGAQVTTARLISPAEPAAPFAGAPALDEERQREGDDPSPHDPQAVQAVAQAPGTGASRVSRLPNGLTLIVLRRPGIPVASMLLGFHADPRPGEIKGVRGVVSVARSFRVERGPLERAILPSSFLDHDSLGEGFGMYSSSAESALDLLSREAAGMTVRWPSPAGAAWLRRVSVREATVEDQAAHVFREALFRDHVYRLDARLDDLRRVEAGDVRAWLDRVRRPANGVLVVVGDVDPETVERQARDKLSDWQGDSSPVPPPPDPPVRAARTSPVAIVSIPNARATWTKIEFGCFLPPVRSPRDGVVGNLLMRTLGDALFRRLRLDMGASYPPSLRRHYLRGGTQILSGVLDVDPRAAPRALAFVHDWLDAAGAETPTTQAIERARWSIARGSGLRDATNADLARDLFYAWNMGWAPASLDAFPRDLASISDAEVSAALTACRASAVATVVGAP